MSQAPAEFQGYRVVTRAEMGEIDRRAALEFGIPALSLMENAGRAVAREIARFLTAVLSKEPAGARVTVCCGRGNNGGDGLAAARHLQALGAAVTAFVAAPRPGRGYPPEVEANLERARSAGVSVSVVEDSGPDAGLAERLRGSDALVDALLGTGASGRPAGAVERMIRAVAAAGRPVVAVDLPSGLDPDTGEHGDACVAAALTLTLGLPKRGLVAPRARGCVGELRVLDIGFPKELLDPHPDPTPKREGRGRRAA